MAQTIPTTADHIESQIEHILVVPREVLIGPNGLHGLIKRASFDHEVDLIHNHGEFLPRPAMEQDPNFKQIIPYLCFVHAGSLFVMQRKATASETRLQNKFSIGIGGHIRSTDIVGGDIAQWATREFEEEVDYKGTYTIQALGLINDDTNAVGQVHIGFAYVIRGDSAEISIKDEHATGILMTKAECLALYDSFETWSKLAFDALKDELV
jgi:predicted NUDIX family phosphoesterase